MEIQDSQGNDADSRGSSRMAFNGPLASSKRNSSKKSARFKDDENPYIELTLDVRDESVVVQNICGTPDQEAALLSDGRLEKRPSLRSQVSLKIRQVSRELKSMTSLKGTRKVDQSRSGAARALLGLRFINQDVGNDGWSEVEARFNELSVDGMLPKSHFAQCVGLNNSSEFVDELFEGLARKRGITSSSITKTQLYEFWEQITNTSFDARLQTFFDMVDKDANGRITEEEVKEIITLSASENKLSKIQESADEYAALIMEELDPQNHGYIWSHIYIYIYIG